MTPPLGVDPGGRYAVVPEDQVLDALVLNCWPYEARGGEAVRPLAATTLERWVAQGLPWRSVGGQRCFDLRQVLNFLRWAGRVHDDPAYWDAAVPTLRRLVRENGCPLDEESRAAPARFEVDLQREFQLPALPRGTLSRLRLPRPYEDAAQHGVEIERLEPTEPAWQVTDTPGRLEFRVPATGAPQVVVLAVRYRLTAHSVRCTVDPALLEPFDVADPLYELYTRPTEGWIKLSPAIRQLAARLAGAAPHAWAALGSFWEFFFATLCSGYLHHDELDPAAFLESLVQRGWFDCLTGSSLLAALCRARGIPARLVGGWILNELTPNMHYWAEVWLPPYGWVPVDLASILLEGRQPSPWRNCFLGGLDYRLKTECYPRVTLGIPGVRFPPAWYLVSRLTDGGVETQYRGLEPARLLYRDVVRVRRLPTSELT